MQQNSRKREASLGNKITEQQKKRRLLDRTGSGQDILTLRGEVAAIRNSVDTYQKLLLETRRDLGSALSGLNQYVLKLLQ